MKTEEAVKSTASVSISRVTLLNILYTQNILAESINGILKRYDLSLEQFSVLMILCEQKGKPANMGVIQKRMIAKASNTTRLVDKLLLKGLVTRDVCMENRRKLEISITQKGLEFLEALTPAVDTLEEKFAGNLTMKELTDLNSLLAKYRIV